MLLFLQMLALSVPRIAFASPIMQQEHSIQTTNLGNLTTSWTSSSSWNSSNHSPEILADQNREKPKGDTLGITRCYCASPHWGQDHTFGYYYLWDYYNFHSDHRFRLERICNSFADTRSGILGSEVYQISCLRPQYDAHECMKDPATGDKFCYILNGRESFDKFKFNHQLRGLPVNSPGEKHASEALVEETCGRLCGSDKVGGLEMLKGIALKYANQKTPTQDKFHAHDNEWSHISFYPEIDDMCRNCKV